MKRLLLAMAALALLASCAPAPGSWGHGWRGGWNCAAPSWNAAPGPNGPGW